MMCPSGLSQQLSLIHWGNSIWIGIIKQVYVQKTCRLFTGKGYNCSGTIVVDAISDEQGIECFTFIGGGANLRGGNFELPGVSLICIPHFFNAFHKTR